MHFKCSGCVTMWLPGCCYAVTKVFQVIHYIARWLLCRSMTLLEFNGWFYFTNITIFCTVYVVYCVAWTFWVVTREFVFGCQGVLGISRWLLALSMCNTNIQRYYPR